MYIQYCPYISFFYILYIDPFSFLFLAHTVLLISSMMLYSKDFPVSVGVSSHCVSVFPFQRKIQISALFLLFSTIFITFTVTCFRTISLKGTWFCQHTVHVAVTFPFFFICLRSWTPTFFSIPYPLSSLCFIVCLPTALFSPFPRQLHLFRAPFLKPSSCQTRQG